MGKTIEALKNASCLVRVYAGFWYLLGPAFAVAIQLFVNSRYGLVEVVDFFTVPDLICLGCCVLLFVSIPVSLRFSTGKKRRVLAIASVASGLGSLALFELSFVVGMPPSVLRIVSIALFSCFFTVQALLWLELFSCYDSMIVFVYVLATAAISWFLCWFLDGLSGSRLLCALVLCMIASGFLLRAGFLRSNDVGLLRPAPSAADIRFGMGLLVLTFFFGFGFMYTTCFMSLEEFHAHHDWVIPLYSICLGGGVLCFSRRISVSLLFRIAVPTMLAGIVLALFEMPAIIPADWLNEIGLFSYLVFLLILYLSAHHARGVESFAMSSQFMLGLYSGIFAGRQFFSLIALVVPADVRPLVFAAIAVAIVVVLVVCAMFGMRIADGMVADGLVRPRLDHVTEYGSDEVSAHIASIYKLSKREEQVLALILEGKSASEVAETLVIAQGTAKAHISNIYKKIGVHERSKLIAMIPGKMK